jgi:hypothetical protein
MERLEDIAHDCSDYEFSSLLDTVRDEMTVDDIERECETLYGPIDPYTIFSECE